MAQSTILAAGTTVATSTDVIVGEVGTVTVGLFVASGDIPAFCSFVVYDVTPGALVPIGSLNKQTPAMTLPYVGTFRVTRNEAGGTSVGVYSESGTPAVGSPGGVGNATATLFTVASLATSQTIKAAVTGRRGLLIVNTDANTLRIKYSATASASSFSVAIPANGYWEMPQPIYTGIIDGIWDADGAGSAFVTELT